MSNQSESINELAAALAKAQAIMGNASKDRSNDFFKASYATLASVWSACRDPLTSNGLSVVQTTEDTPTGVVLRTALLHSSGQWISSTYPIRPVKQDPQGMGSALSYGKRYSLAALVGIASADEDDDGERSMGRGGNGFDALDKPRQQEQRRPAPPPPKKALPPLPNDITHIPQEILDVIAPLRPLNAVPFKAMKLEDLELVIAQVRAMRPKFSTSEGKNWLNALEATAEHMRQALESERQ